MFITRSNSTRGFILLDVLIGMIILSVGVLTIGELYFQSGRSSVFADNRSEAFNWAQQRIEYLESDQSWRGSALLGTPPTNPADPDNANPPRTGFNRVTTVAVANLPEGTLPATTTAVNVPIAKINNHLVDVTVTVNWLENGIPRTVSLRTLIQRYP